MLRLPLLLIAFVGSLLGVPRPARADELKEGLYNPLHGYSSEPPQDRFSRLRAELNAGRVTLETTGGEIALLRSVLTALEVPVSSQMLVYSVTSLQKALISPRRPRALYFNEDTYVGFVPDGRIEVISTDPHIGNVFYIFDRPASSGSATFRRSEECMTCHAPHYLGSIPALLLESVIPGMTGGGERAFRREQSGHGVPLGLRFGGWHLTGVGPGFPKNWGNLTIDRHDGVADEIPNPPGTYFNWSRYPRATSDVLPQLLQEHQVGFVNRALQAAYGAREALAVPEAPPQQKAAALCLLAKPLVRYLLFADEVPLPADSVTGEAEYRSDFLSRKRAARDGTSLRDFELSTRLFRYRCSYMIYSPAFTGLPGELRSEVLRQVRSALGGTEPDYAYLPVPEREAIARILGETLPDFGG